MYSKAGKHSNMTLGSSVVKVSKETVEEVQNYPFKANPDRNISKETCQRYGVRAGLSEEDGSTVVAYYFPSYNQKGKLVGYMKQDVTKNKEEPFHWSAVGSVVIANKLFGQDVSEKVSRKRQNLIITEGQWDCLSSYQCLVDDVRGTKYEGLEPHVVSIPLGTANAVEAVLHNDEFVKMHEALTIFFDDDYCTPAETKKGIMKGHEAREALAGALVGSGISLMTVMASDGFKDASDYLQAGKSKELAKKLAFERKPFTAEKIVKAADISFEELLAPRPEGIYVKSFPKLMEKLHGFRTKELVTFCAPSNVGKSTVTSMFASAFIEQGEKTAMIFLEETAKETLQRMIASHLKVSFNKFRQKPESCATKEQIKAAYDYIAGQDKLIMLDHFGSMNLEDFMRKIKHMHLIEGCKYIIVDHLSMLISGLEVADERKQMDMTMTQLAAFAAANEVCIIAVSHINRSGADQFRPPKGKEDEAYWVRVTKEMMRSSSSLEQLSWTVLGLEPEIMPDRSRGRVRLTVLKNRTFSELGVADTFTIDNDTWEVVLSEDDTEF